MFGWGTNDQAAATFAHEEGVELAREEALNKQIEELTAEGKEFDPWSPEHFSYALDNISESLMKYLSQCGRTGQTWHCGEVVTSHVRVFWEIEAGKRIEGVRYEID